MHQEPDHCAGCAVGNVIQSLWDSYGDPKELTAFMAGALGAVAYIAVHHIASDHDDAREALAEIFRSAFDSEFAEMISEEAETTTTQ